MGASAQRSVGSGQAAELEGAAKALRDFLDCIRARAQASRRGTSWARWSFGDSRRIRLDGFAEAGRRDGGTIATLGRLGRERTLRRQRVSPAVLETCQQALAGRGPKDFLYGDLLLAKARARELAKDSPGAVATYKQYLKDLPSSDRVGDVRIPTRPSRRRRLADPLFAGPQWGCAR